MKRRDGLEKERVDAKNTLEEYVYEMRGKIDNGNVEHLLNIDV